MIRLLLVHILAGAAFCLTSVAADRLVLCGMDEVFVISADTVTPALKETGGEAAKETGPVTGTEPAKESGAVKASSSSSAPASSPAPSSSPVTPDKLWSWRAKDRPELPEKLRAGFATTDEIKVLEGGRRMLITSSSGGCALVEYSFGKVLWYAQVPNAHSIEALPGNLVVVASSVSKEGNRLILFDLARSNEPLCSTPLPSAHGVIWDAEAKRLWALGFEELRRYEITGLPGSPSDAGASSGSGADAGASVEARSAGGKTDAARATSAAPDASVTSTLPGFWLEASFRWPGKDGHDLQAVPGSRDLVLSCEDGVWLFDRKSESFRPHPELGSKLEVKSVSPHPKTGRIAWTMAGGGEWWTREVRFLNPEAVLTLPKEKLYKVRWLPEEGVVKEP